MRRLLVLMALAQPALAAADVPSPFASLVQVVLGLVVVLGAIVGCAWLFRRLGGATLGTQSWLRVVGGTLVGQRERVVIVEVAGEWLVLGVTAHNVNLLARMARPEGAEAPPPMPQMPEHFSKWMKAALDKARKPADPR